MAAQKTSAAPAAVACPQCGGALLATPALDKRAIVKRMVDTGGKAEYAHTFADTHHEKEAAHGVVHVCTACRYVTRIKEAA